MVITQLPTPDLSIRCDQYTERSEGLHLSRISHDILTTLDPDRFGEREGGPNWMNFLMGLIFERALEMAWMDRERQVRPELVRIGEVEVDGITCTVDAFDTIFNHPEEYKCTKMSCRQDITDRKFWHYWAQLKAYAYVLGATSGVLWVLHVNGNYSRDYSDPDSGYVLRGYRAQFSPTELAENWAMHVNHARRKGWIN